MSRTAYSHIQQEIVAFLAKYIPSHLVKAEDITAPPNYEMGDFAYPCFGLAKELQKSPVQIAQEIAQKAEPNEIIVKVQAAGPYLNVIVSSKFLANTTLKEFSLLENALSQNKKVMVEYSGPNPCKTFHVGHFRNTILGSTIINLYRFAGFDVMPVNYLNDTGTHVAKVIWLYLRSYEGKEPQENQGEWLGELYVEANNMLTDNPDLMEEVYAIHRKLEQRDQQVAELLQKFKIWSKQEFDRIYSELDAEFEKDFYDSEYIDSGKELIAELLAKGIAKKSEGAIIVDLEEYGLHVALILKSDGSALYITKDLSMARDRFNEYNVDRLVYVVGAEQILHFKQVFKILELYGFERAKDCHHLAYELVNTASGKKMSTREGTVVLYNDLVNQAYDLLYKETESRHKDDWSQSEIEVTAKTLALAALKFDMLKQDAQKRINFDITKAIDVSGDTGPYIIYTMARLRSILDKANVNDFGDADVSLLENLEERELLHAMLQLQTVCENAFANHKPSMIAHYLLDLARSVNNFYHKYPILDEDEKVQKARLLLILKAIEVCEAGLTMLNIKWVNKM